MSRWGKRRAVRALACLCAAALLLAPFSPWGALRAHAFDMAEEKKIGRQTLEKVRMLFPVVEDGEVAAYVSAVGNRVARELGPSPYDFQFVVINQSVPNAFAVPGGFIFVYRGIIELMSSEGELASILAHELSHVQAQHIDRQMKKARVLSIASIAALIASAFVRGGGGAMQGAAMGTVGAAQAMQLQYSREHEEEADRLGFRLMCAAGYNPADMAGMMGKLARMPGGGASGVPTYLMTHPALSDRVLYLQTMSQQHSDIQCLERPPSGNFFLMQAALIADNRDPYRALDIFKAWRHDKGREAAVAFGKGRAQIRLGKTREGLESLKLAARLSPGDPLVLSALGDAYFQDGQFAEARQVLETALSLNPGGQVLHYRLARVLEEQGDIRGALAHLREAEPLSAIIPDIDQRLGVLYGKVGDLGMAHLRLARYSQHRRQWDTAIFHYEKARSLLSGSPDILDDIKTQLDEIKHAKKEASGHATFGG